MEPVNNDQVVQMVLAGLALLFLGVTPKSEGNNMSPFKQVLLAISRRAATALGGSLAGYGLATDEVQAATAALVVLSGLLVDVLHSAVAARWGFK